MTSVRKGREMGGEERRKDEGERAHSGGTFTGGTLTSSRARFLLYAGLTLGGGPLGRIVRGGSASSMTVEPALLGMEPPWTC